MLKGKNILLGITGSIAAYKAANLVRLLVKEGADVRVLMTPLAKEFITPLTLATLSKHSILVDFFDPTNGQWNSHVDIGMWADAYVIAPATANTIGKMANGIADNLLLTTYLSARCQVFVAPAMDLDMFAHVTTQNNLKTLANQGVKIIEPSTGELASGLEGKGRMEEPEKIVAAISAFFETAKRLDGKKILVTAGPTFENIDPVRFIGNYSSGKMGYALAEECANEGAEVFLISGPVAVKTVHKNIKVISVVSADEMLEQCLKYFSVCDAAIMAAAVADFKPKEKEKSKIKRQEREGMVIELVPNPDIAANLGSLKNKNQVLVGFALETDNMLENAKGKLSKKNLDFIVLNPANVENAGFKSDNNIITIIDQTGDVKAYENKPKHLVAKDICDCLYLHLQKK
ncbi:MAG TPA: bifunctional phosphopantothenoylcysteine decarboxylase/phosphopantothenate--cysteine ligase CoaBC [Bacteroidales bacterium]|nr:bifunctional phosphopantothenoylcysteine decarboxylase/phosphopantothenate--cysteine ligase CoaBC [Bacteroidales bacterium]